MGIISINAKVIKISSIKKNLSKGLETESSYMLWGTDLEIRTAKDTVNLHNRDSRESNLSDEWEGRLKNLRNGCSDRF